MGGSSILLRGQGINYVVDSQNGVLFCGLSTAEDVRGCAQATARNHTPAILWVKEWLEDNIQIHKNTGAVQCHVLCDEVAISVSTHVQCVPTCNSPPTQGCYYSDPRCSGN